MTEKKTCEAGNCIRLGEIYPYGEKQLLAFLIDDLRVDISQLGFIENGVKPLLYIEWVLCHFLKNTCLRSENVLLYI